MNKHKFKKLDVVVALLIAGLFVFSWGAQIGFSWSGTTNTLSSGYMEVDNVNVTSGFYWNSVNRTDTFAYPEQGASYIIFTDGTNIYAKNGETGQIDYGGADHSSVFQSVFGALPNGGAILVKSGTILLTSTTITTQSNISLIGEGPSTRIDVQISNGYGLYFQNSSNIIVKNIYFTGMPSENENHVLAFRNVTNMWVEENIFEDCGDEAIQIFKNCQNGITRNNLFLNGPIGAEAACISLQSGHQLVEGNIIIADGGDGHGITLGAVTGTATIEKVIIKNNIIKGGGTLDYGILLNAVDFDINDVIIEGNEIYDVVSGGIVDGVGGTSHVNEITISNNIIKGGGVGASNLAAIRVNKNEPTRVVVTGNSVYDWSPDDTGRGIDVNSDNAMIIGNKVERCGNPGIYGLGDRINVIGNTVKDAELQTTNGGIYIVFSDRFIVSGNVVQNGFRGINIYDDTATNGSISNNMVYNTTQPIDDDGIGNTIRNNAGYMTENSGTQTCADNEDIVHGLAGSPTFVDVTPMNDTYDGVPVIANVDWANVDGTNIQVGLYWVNGTAISDDIILVAWSATYEP